MMDERRVCISRSLGMKRRLPVLPAIRRTYLASEQWKAQDIVIHSDLNRTSNLSHPRARRIMMRYASHLPRCGYIQGQLYLLRVLFDVSNDERWVFWAFVFLTIRTNPFGPLGFDSGDPPALPHWVVDRASLSVDAGLLSRFISLRWAYILWGQSCDDRNELLWPVWNFVLRGRIHIMSFAAAMLDYVTDRLGLGMLEEGDLPFVFGYQLSSQEEVGKVLAEAQQIAINHSTWK